jgi:hypothetical protein
MHADVGLRRANANKLELSSFSVFIAHLLFTGAYTAYLGNGRAFNAREIGSSRRR